MFTVTEDGFVVELNVHIEDCMCEDFCEDGFNSNNVHIDDVDALRHAGHI